MTNYEALNQMPLKFFANMVFDIVRNEVNSAEEFTVFLNKEIPGNLEEKIKAALQDMQCHLED